MHRRPHDERDGMKVWLSESEVEQYLGTVEDITHRIALGLAFRCGLRSAEVVAVTPADVVDGPADMVHDVTEEGLHLDVYRDGEKVDTDQVFGPLPAAQAFTAAEEHLATHAERYINRFREWHSTNRSDT